METQPEREDLGEILRNLFHLFTVSIYWSCYLLGPVTHDRYKSEFIRLGVCNNIRSTTVVVRYIKPATSTVGVGYLCTWDCRSEFA